jgi:hypothetical protein
MIAGVGPWAVVSLLGGVVGFQLAALIAIVIRLSEMRERLAHCEEWQRWAEKRLNGH